MLKKLKEQGITILVSTPYMDEASLCERIALIQDGSILKIDTPIRIIQDYPTKLYAVRAKDMYRLLHDYRNHDAIESSYTFGEFLHVTLHADGDGVQLLKQFAEKCGHTEIKVEAIAPSIEDSFIRLMNK